MGTIYFKCPVCKNDIHFKSKDNVFPVNYKLKCKYCTSIFGFIPKVFVKADFTLHGEKSIAEDEINDILEFRDEDEPMLNMTSPINELVSAIDEFENHNVEKEKRNPKQI